MSQTVTIVDYGLGNIFSVSRAIEHFGAEVLLTDRPSKVLEAERLILPGVGAFANGMQGLRDRGLVEPLREYAKNDRPFLGICLGMQMMVSESEEFGRHEGLGIIPGKVTAIRGADASGTPVKVPHIGWSALARPGTRPGWGGTILAGTAEKTSAYFVHSFTVVPDREEDRLADTWYGDCRVSAAIQRGSVSGCQFHPEKSGPNGLRIIRNFLGLA
jgi:glutamine amidotransferase